MDNICSDSFGLINLFGFEIGTFDLGAIGGKVIFEAVISTVYLLNTNLLE